MSGVNPPESHAARVTNRTQTGRPRCGRESSQKAAIRYAILSNIKIWSYVCTLYTLEGPWRLRWSLVVTATGLWAAGDTEEEPAAAMEKEMVRDPSHRHDGNGARIRRTLTMSKSGGFPPTADPYFSTAWATHSLLASVLENLSIADWALNRDEFDWSSYAVPLFGLRGALAESWIFPRTASPIPSTSAREFTGTISHR